MTRRPGGIPPGLFLTSSIYTNGLIAIVEMEFLHLLATAL